MARSIIKRPIFLVGLVLFLGSASVALGTSITIPGLQDFNWTQDARGGSDLIRWFRQLSGASADISAGIFFVLPLFAARWLLPRPGESKKEDEVWRDRHRRPSLNRTLIHLAMELGLVLCISAALGASLALYLSEVVLPGAAPSKSFVLDTVLAVVGATIIYFALVRAIDRLNLVDGATALTFCGASATIVAALESLLPFHFASMHNMEPRLAHGLLLSTLAVPIVIVLLGAQWKVRVQVDSSIARKSVQKVTMPFRLVPEKTLRLTIGVFLWIVATAMTTAGAIGHMNASDAQKLDWLMFALQPILISLLFYRLATRTLESETRVLASQLLRTNTYLPGVRPGARTRDYLTFEFRRMLAAAAIFAGAISALVAVLFWLNGSSPLQCLQGLAWIWTIGAASAALLRGIEARTQRRASAAYWILPLMRWTPARCQFTLLCITALIDRELAPEEQIEAMALGKRTQTLHETDVGTLGRWLSDIQKRKDDRVALLDLASHAIDSYPSDMDMRRAIYAQCADIAHADRVIKLSEQTFMQFMAHGLRLQTTDRKLIDAVIQAKNRH